MQNPTSVRHDGVIDWAAHIPSEDSLALAEAAREHFSALFTIDDVRRAQAGGSPPGLWPALSRHGYVLIGLPERLDGIGSPVDLVGILEEAGRAVLPAPLLTTAAALQTLAAVDALDDPGESPVALGWRGGPDVFALDGADAAHVVLVEASGSDECVVRRLELDGAMRRTIPAVDPSRPIIQLDGGLAVVDEKRVAADVDAALAAARTCLAADLVGLAARAVTRSIDHVLARHQFGRPIGSFQGVKHLLADAHVTVERARSLTRGAAVELTDDPLSPASAKLSVLAKAAAGDAALQATALHTQLLGAMGLTAESDAPIGVRRARQSVPVLGSPGELYATAASMLGQGATRGV